MHDACEDIAHVGMKCFSHFAPDEHFEGVVAAGPRVPLIHDARAMTRQWMRTVVKYPRKNNKDLSIDGKMRMHPWKMKMEMKRLM